MTWNWLIRAHWKFENLIDYYERASRFSFQQGIEQVFINIGLGLINLSTESTCSSMKRYESRDSLYSSMNSSTTNLSETYDGVHMAIDISHPNVETNGEGRVEIGGPWSRDAIAHADIQRSGWCCWKAKYTPVYDQDIYKSNILYGFLIKSLWNLGL